MFGFSHSSHSDLGRSTGMRSWTGLIVPFADVVTTVAECNQRSSPSPASGSFHTDQSPATASGSPFWDWMNIGCFAGLPFAVTGPDPPSEVRVPAFHS